MRVVGYVATAVLAAAVLGAVAVGFSSSGDVQRYLRMRKM